MKCMLCGRENPDGALYCGGCGWPQKKQKSGGGWLIAVLGCAAVLLIAAAVVIFFRPAAASEALPAETAATEITETKASAQPTYYELVAKTFVETYWNNDLPTMETLVEYHYYSYLEAELDTGRAVACTAEATESTPCDKDRIVDIEMTLSYMGGYDTVTEAYVVKVNYTAEEQTGSTEVTVGKIGDDWLVVSYRPFYAD